MLSNDVLVPTLATLPAPAVFFIGIALLALFLWYFGTDSDRRKRVIGAFLTLGLSAFCFYHAWPPSKLPLGMDLAGGVRFVVEIQKVGERDVDQAAQDQVVNVLSRRFNELGTSDISIRAEGTNRVSVDIPNRDGQEITEEKVAEIRTAITKSAVLNFHLAHDDYRSVSAEAVHKGDEFVVGGKPVPYQVGSGPIASAQAEQMRGEGATEEMIREAAKTLPTEYMLVNSLPDIPGRTVKRAFASYGQAQWEIHLTLDNEGAKKMAIFSGKFNEQLGNARPMAIVLDGEILSAPVYRNAIPGGSAVITGKYTASEARALGASMTNPLESSLVPVSTVVFPPKLGQLAIKQGFTAAISGLTLTILFMMIYYRFAGLVALIGLSVNMTLLFGIMAIFGSDFTLTGIAGVILTLGIAIDANVLIYERLREELNDGKSLGAAIRAAYDKAFSAIFDANITTLITAMILLFLAAGAIKGFALTLTIGIIVSLFSALLVTRVTFNWGMELGLVKKLGFMSILGKRAIDFLGLSKTTRYASIALVILGIAVVGIRGNDIFGIEFVGGDKVEMKTDGGVAVADVEAAIAGVALEKEPIIERTKPLGGDGEFVVISTESGKSPLIIEALKKEFGVSEGTDLAVQTIGGGVAGEMLTKSIIALLVGLVAIGLYVSVRFEPAFALGAIVALVHDLVIVIGIVALTGKEINLIMVGAFLTIAGYSINDTIVIFDRIREGLKTGRGEVKDIMNTAINTTLSRTILTSITTLITVSALYLFGGPALSNFSFALIIGVLVGTYSSIFVAAPIVHWWARKRKKNLRREVLDADQTTITANPVA